MQYREYFKDLIKKDEQTNVKPSDEKKVSDEGRLLKVLLECQGRFEQHFFDEPLEDGIRWIMGYSNYINQTFLKERPKISFSKTFVKGSIIYVDFFGNFGNELTYDHPAIVLAESGNDLIVAPITSSPTIYEDDLLYHISLPAEDVTLGKMPNPCTIKLEQLRFISRRRIRINFKNRVSDNEKLKEIDIALMKLLAEYTFNNYEQSSIAYEELKILSEDLEKVLVDTLKVAEQLDKECIDLDQENQTLFSEKEGLLTEMGVLETECENLRKEIENLKKQQSKDQQSQEYTQKVAEKEGI